VLNFGVVALGVTDVQRAAEFWSAALGYTLREDGFGGWAKVRLHFDLHRPQP
jgi:catechol 2,3-dioxygenase-like lactoylglutathione lyase family enzyme